MRRRLFNLLFLVCALTLSAWADPPKRAVIMVFDHTRAEYMTRFDLPNFKRARDLGVTFENAYVGQLEANTIISHPTITSGKLPKHMGWGAEIWRDPEGEFGKKGAYISPFLLSHRQWMDSLRLHAATTSLVARIKEVNPGPAFAVAQKEYAAYTYGGPFADRIVCLGPVIKEGPWKGHHSIGGYNVPDYISRPEGNRFYLDGVSTWGSEVERYSMHGSGYVTGDDPKRPGGDAWVGDVVEQLMDHEPNWSVILASFGATDKVSHVLAEHDSPTSAAWAIANGISLADTQRKADYELGRILDRLQAKHLLKETVIVITADHGGQKNSTFYGRNRPGLYKEDMYYAKDTDLGFEYDFHPVIKPFLKNDMLEAMSMDTVALFWTRELNAEEEADFREHFRAIPGVCEAYRKLQRPDGSYHYERFFRSPDLKGRELEWAKAHNPTLVDSMASASGPEFVGLLFDNTGYGLIGAHGGAQELVQRIPMLVIAPQLQPAQTSRQWVRLVDVNPIVGNLMHLKSQPDLDGRANALDSLKYR